MEGLYGMDGRQKVKIKLCGMSRPEDVLCVNEARPDFCGFVINVPKSIRNVSPGQLRELLKLLDPEIVPVGVFRDEPLESVASFLEEGVIRMAQIHGHEDENYIRELKSRGDFTVIRAFNERTFGEAEGSCADYVLLDHGEGGTGESFDWTMTDSIRRPFFLAGGIGPENIEEALRQVRPWAVDMSSGLETDGKKDPKKILAAMQAVRRWNEEQELKRQKQEQIHRRTGE